METTRNIFWGLVLKPGKRYETEVQEAFRVTKACVEPSSAGGKVSSVMVECDNSEEFIIANLGPKLYNETLDLAFNEGEKICFKVDGPGTIHLTGNILEENSPPDDSSMFDMMGSESSEGEEEESENEVEAGDKIKEVSSEDEKLAKKPLKRKKDDQQAGSGKKTKLDAEDMDTTADTTKGDLDDTDNLAEENDSDEEDDDSDDDDSEDEGETTADPADTTTDVTVASDNEEDSDDDEDDSDEEEDTVETKKVETLEQIKENTIGQNGVTPKKSKITAEVSSEVAPEEVKEKEAELPKTPKEGKSTKEPKTPKEEIVKTEKLPETPIIEKPTESKTPKEKKAKKEVNTPKPEAKTPKPDVKKQDMKTPKPEAKASIEETKTPKAEAKTPKAEAKTPKVEAKTLKAEAKTPKAEAKTPKAEGKTPKAEAKTPKAEAKTPKQDVKTPKQESKTPKDAETPGKTPKRTLKGNVTTEDLKEGTGPEAKAGNIVGMYYAGRLKKNNKQFDATLTGKPFKFKLGSGQVIKGWDVGVLGMKVGGKRKLTIPAAMAYGSQGAPPDIAPNADLVFDIECKFVK